MKEIENFCGRLKSHDAALLVNGEGGNPDGDEAILTVGQSIIRVSDDVKEKFAIASAMDLLCGG